MISQIQKRSREDAAKKRREYLFSVGRANMAAAAALGAAVLFAIPVLFAIGSMLIELASGRMPGVMSGLGGIVFYHVRWPCIPRLDHASTLHA